MAEIEHFVNPEEKDHPKFDIVSGDCLPLFPQDNQLGDWKIISDKTLKTAVSDGTINNQTLAYFMARTYYILLTHFSQTPTPTGTFAFLTSIGIKRLTFDFVSISKWDGTLPPTAGMLRSISPTDGRNVGIAIVPALIWQSMLKLRKWIWRPRKSTTNLYVLLYHSPHSNITKTRTPTHRYRPKYSSGTSIVRFSERHSREIKRPWRHTWTNSRQTKPKLWWTRSNRKERSRSRHVKESSSWRAKWSRVSRSRQRMSRRRRIFPVWSNPRSVWVVFYAIMEHSFSTRPQSDEDKKKVQKGVMSFPPSVSRQVCRVCTLESWWGMKAKCVEMSRELTKLSISNRLDMSSTTIGKRYVRFIRARSARTLVSNPSNITVALFHHRTLQQVPLMNSVCPLSSRSILRLSTRQNANLRIVSILSL